jgi:hypothetical protein
MVRSWPLRSIGQKGSAGVRKAVGYNMSSFANSPVNGLLYMTGSLGALPVHRPSRPAPAACAMQLHDQACHIAKAVGKLSSCACIMAAVLLRAVIEKSKNQQVNKPIVLGKQCNNSDFDTGGSAAEPEGKVVVQLCDGAIGTTRLATANARAAIDASQRLDFAVELEPAAARNAGHLKVAGVVPLSEVPPLRLNFLHIPHAQCPNPCCAAHPMPRHQLVLAVALRIRLAAVPSVTRERVCCAAGGRRPGDGRAEGGGGREGQRHDDRDDGGAGDAVDRRRRAPAAHVRAPAPAAKPHLPLQLSILLGRTVVTVGHGGTCDRRLAACWDSKVCCCLVQGVWAPGGSQVWRQAGGVQGQLRLPLAAAVPRHRPHRHGESSCWLELRWDGGGMASHVLSGPVCTSNVVLTVNRNSAQYTAGLP